MYFFRLLPWRFFGIWDGGIVLISLFVSFIIITTLLVLFYKKWRWKHMFFPIYLSSLSMLSFSFVSIGIEQNNSSWILQGILIMIFLILVFFAYKLLDKKISKIQKKKSLFSWFGIISVLISAAYVVYIYLSIDIPMLERINIYVFGVWVIISCVFFLIDLQKANVSIEKLSSVSSISVIDINQPIKLPRK
jgi:quinol-cytochrome oxidoreductase complex cytochrome b subunit